MGLTWRDLVATALVAGALAVGWASITAAGWPLMDNTRIAATVVFALGLGACITGAEAGYENDPERKRWYHRVGGFLGGAAGLSWLAAVIFGQVWMLWILLGVIGALWVFATVRHTVMRRQAPLPAEASA